MSHPQSEKRQQGSPRNEPHAAADACGNLAFITPRTNVTRGVLRKARSFRDGQDIIQRRVEVPPMESGVQ
ncbi:hypothetical protein PZC41_14445 [Staphylococcus aureus]|nr:hypothetical protein [Staphylococcus aureus]MDE8535504.1 hypothetical protein [Staphylococcus aureus]